MNLQQVAFIALISLLTIAFIVIVSLLLINSQSPDITIMQDSARQCASQIVGNCIVR